MLGRAACYYRVTYICSRSITSGTHVSSTTNSISPPYLSPSWPKNSPQGYQYAYLPEPDAVTLIPDGWHTASELGENRATYFVTKENAMEDKQFQTGFTIGHWKCDSIPANIVMEQIAAHHIGVVPSRYLAWLQTAAKSPTVPYNFSFLQDLGVLLLDEKMTNIKDCVYEKSREFIKLQKDSEDFYVNSRVFAVPSRNTVSSVLFECPLSLHEDYKPLLKTILDYSLFGCHSENARILFSGELTEKKE